MICAGAFAVKIVGVEPGFASFSGIALRTSSY